MAGMDERDDMVRLKSGGELEKTRRVATQVRNALDSIDKTATRCSILQQRDCGHTALLLAMHLEAKGCGAFSYVNAGRTGPDGEAEYHSWLQRGNLIVDISGKEFSDCPDSIVVELESPWHRQFGATPDDVDEDYKAITSDWPELHAAYEEVCAVLNETP